jgi:hypothetical protein
LEYNSYGPPVCEEFLSGEVFYICSLAITDDSFLWLQCSDYASYKAGFSTSRRSYEKEKFSLFDGEVYIFQYGALSVRETDMGE